jgi:hypothetical protein
VVVDVTSKCTFRDHNLANGLYRDHAHNRDWGR